MKNILCLFLGVIIGGIAVFYYFNYNINKESTEEIEKEISIYNEKISLLDKEIAKYSGGLIHALLETQRAIYGETIASLESKKSQFSHWISLNYPSQSKVSNSYGEIKDYDEEIDKLAKTIKADKEESAKYGECLMKALIDTRIAQNQLTLSSLERARIAKKFHIPFIMLPNDKDLEKNEPKINQTPAQDKESL